MKDRPPVAFIGLGAIGTPMARHLAAKTDLVVWNRTLARARDFAAATGCRAADTAADAVAGADFIFTCLPTSQDVEAIFFGDNGAAPALEPDSLVVDCTSGDPATSRSIAARLAKYGAGMIDAPVSGGVAGAESGKLTVMAGGDAELLERAHPLLECFAAKIVHCGVLGSGEAIKAVNNALLALHIWSAGEGLTALTTMGVDPAVALDVINSSSGRSNASMNLFPERVLTRAFPRTFKLALLDKDVRIASEIAHAAGTPSDLIDLAAKLFAEAHKELGEEADHVEAVRVIERRAGTSIS